MLNVVDQYSIVKQREKYIMHLTSLNYEKMIIRMKEFIQEDFYNIMYYYKLSPGTTIKTLFPGIEPGKLDALFEYGNEPNVVSLGEDKVVNSMKSILMDFISQDQDQDTDPNFIPSGEIYINAGIKEIKEQLKYSTERKFNFPNNDIILNNNSISLAFDTIIQYLNVETEINKPNYFNTNLKFIKNMSGLNKPGGPLIELKEKDHIFLKRFLLYTDQSFNITSYIANNYDPVNIQKIHSKYFINQMNLDIHSQANPSVAKNILANYKYIEEYASIHTDTTDLSDPSDATQYIINYFNLNPDLITEKDDPSSQYYKNIYNSMLCQFMWEPQLMLKNKAYVIDLPFLKRSVRGEIEDGKITTYGSIDSNTVGAILTGTSTDYTMPIRNYIDLSDILSQVLSLSSSSSQTNTNYQKYFSNVFLRITFRSNSLPTDAKEDLEKLRTIPNSYCYNYFGSISPNYIIEWTIGEDIGEEEINKLVMDETLGPSSEVTNSNSKFEIKSKPRSTTDPHKQLTEISENCSGLGGSITNCIFLVNCGYTNAKVCTSTGFLHYQRACKPKNPDAEADNDADAEPGIFSNNIFGDSYQYFLSFIKLTYNKPCFEENMDNYEYIDRRFIAILIFIIALFTTKILFKDNNSINFKLTIPSIIYRCIIVCFIGYYIIQFIQAIYSGTPEIMYDGCSDVNDDCGTATQCSAIHDNNFGYIYGALFFFLLLPTIISKFYKKS
jgi:hypothetical protein